MGSLGDRKEDRKKGTGKNPPLLQGQRAGKALGCREEQGWGLQPTFLSGSRIKLLISQNAKIPRPGLSASAQPVTLPPWTLE